MDKKEILAKAQKENKGQEYESYAIKKNTNWALFGGGVLGVVMIAIEYLMQGTINSALIVLFGVMGGIMNLLDGIKTRKMSLIIVGVMCLLSAIIFFAYFLVQVR